jgi:hypothetical protein
LNLRATLVASILALSAPAAALAHHSVVANYDTSRQIEIVGEVVEWQFRNPHSLIVVNGNAVVDGVPIGETPERWEIEVAGAAALRSAAGIEADSIRVGDRLRVRAWPHRNASLRRANSIAAASTPLLTENGVPIGSAQVASEPTPADGVGAQRLAGLWSPPSQRPGARSPLALTDAGRAAWDAYDQKLSPATTCETMSIPDIFTAPRYVVTIEIDESRAVVSNQLYNVVRTAGLDGTARTADPDGRFGTISGRIEGDALVLESRDYPASAWGLGSATQLMGAGADVPASAQKTVVERFTVSEDGLTLTYAFTVDDPVYLTEPFSHSFEMARLPDDTLIYPYDCDVEAAAQFSRD